MTKKIPPKEMAKKLVRHLRPERPDSLYLKKVFEYIRELLSMTPQKKEKRLPELLTDDGLISFYEVVWQARHRTHMVMIKLLIFTGVRNRELARLRLKDVDLRSLQIRIEQGKGRKCFVKHLRPYVAFLVMWRRPQMLPRINLPASFYAT